MRETKKRSLIKALVWRTEALLVTFGVFWFYTGNLYITTMGTFVAQSFKTILYYITERLFQRWKYGYEDV